MANDLNARVPRNTPDLGGAIGAGLACGGFRYLAFQDGIFDAPLAADLGLRALAALFAALFTLETSSKIADMLGLKFGDEKLKLKRQKISFPALSRFAGVASTALAGFFPSYLRA